MGRAKNRQQAAIASEGLPTRGRLAPSTPGVAPLSKEEMDLRTNTQKVVATITGTQEKMSNQIFESVRDYLHLTGADMSGAGGQNVAYLHGALAKHGSAKAVTSESYHGLKDRATLHANADESMLHAFTLIKEETLRRTGPTQRMHDLENDVRGKFDSSKALRAFAAKLADQGPALTQQDQQRAYEQLLAYDHNVHNGQWADAVNVLAV